MTTPKAVSDFAKEYQQLYIANCQLNGVLEINRRQIKLAVDFCNEHPESDIAKVVKSILYMVTPIEQ